MTSMRRAVDLDPDNVKSRIALAFMLEESGDVGGAIAEFTAVLERDPGNANARARLEQLRGRGGS